MSNGSTVIKDTFSSWISLQSKQKKFYMRKNIYTYICAGVYISYFFQYFSKGKGGKKFQFLTHLDALFGTLFQIFLKNEEHLW